MGSTITEKILAAHCGKKVVCPGEFIEPKIDMALSNDVTAPLQLKSLENQVQKKFLTKTKYLWLWIILLQIKIS